MKRLIKKIASFASNGMNAMRHFAIYIQIYLAGCIQEAAMKRAIMFAIVIMALGVNSAFAVDCPDIQYIRQFDIAQDGAGVARVAAGSDRKVYVADMNGGFLKIYYSDGEFIQASLREALQLISPVWSPVMLTVTGLDDGILLPFTRKS